MPFLTRVQAAEPFETWASMERAAGQRFWDGFLLATSEAGHEAGAIYLLGYTSEMLLKTAYSRLIGVSSSDDTGPYLRAVRTHASWTGRNLHDLRAWGDYLTDIRRLRGLPLSAATAGQIRQRVLTVDVHWRETLRYAAVPATADEANEVFLAAEWLRDNYALLWR